MEWAAIKAGMAAVIQTASRVSDLQVEWKDADTGVTFRDPDFVNLSTVSVETFGQGERRRTINATDFTERVFSVRGFTLQLDFDSQDQPYRAMQLADITAAGLQSTEAREALAAMNLGIASVGNPRYVPYRDSHDRMRSAAILEVTFNSSTTVDMGEIDFVDSVEGEGTVDSISVPFSESLT